MDIDGVLNGHEDVFLTGIHTISRTPIQLLNTLIERTDADIVISSAWRYMILGAAMKIDGFRYMLNTHGLAPSVRIAGHTCSDEEIPERGDQIADYCRRNGITNYVILDDGSPTMSGSLYDVHGDRWIVTDAAVGLTAHDVEAAVRVLLSEDS